MQHTQYTNHQRNGKDLANQNQSKRKRKFNEKCKKENFYVNNLREVRDAH